MAEKKNNAPHDLQQTKGMFTFRGVTTGTDKDSFYKETKTKSGDKPFRAVSFGIEYETGKKDYISLNGMERDNAYFSKKETVDGKSKVVIEKVAWKDRDSFSKEGFGLIGIGLGLEKVTENGKTFNKKETLVEWDACEKIKNTLTDGQSVFIKGNIEYSSYNDKHYTKFIPQQISLCSSDIDFEAEDFKSNHFFTQQIVFMGIRKDAESKDKPRFIISGKIIGYSTIEDVEFVTYNPKLATTFNKKLKPYTAITIYGDIDVSTSVDTVEEEDDEWGESNKMERNNAPFVRELVVTGADKNSIDTELYSEESVESTIAKLAAKDKTNKEYGSDDSDDWGSSSDTNSDEDDEW